MPVSTCVEHKNLIGVELPIPAWISETSPQVVNEAFVQQLSLSPVIHRVRKPVLDQVVNFRLGACSPGAQGHIDWRGFQVFGVVPVSTTRNSLADLAYFLFQLGPRGLHESVEKSTNPLFPRMVDLHFPAYRSHNGIQPIKSDTFLGIYNHYAY